MNVRSTLLIGILLAAGVVSVRGQESTEPDIQKRLDLIRRGNSDQVRNELPALMKQYPQNPGLLYLQGVLTTDGGEAVRIFQNLADNFPKSEWADDALYKTYQYYYALGLYQTADQKLERLKRDYPQSPYLRSLQQQAAMQPPAAKEPAPQPAAAAPERKQQPVAESKPPAEPAVVEQKAPAPAVTPTPSASGTYTVQTGVFSSRQNAERFKNDLSQAGVTAEIRTRQIGGRDMYTVCVGTYATYQLAQQQVEVLKGKNITGIVTGR